MKICECGRSPTRYCIGWHDLDHEEWQTQKIITEAKLRAELTKQDYQKFVSKQKSIHAG